MNIWLVHCAGKVASVSISQALAGAGLASRGSRVFKTHMLNRENLDRAVANTGSGGHLGASLEFLERFSAGDYEHCFAIVGRRDPVAQAVSAFFQNIVQFTGRETITVSDRDAVLTSLHERIGRLIDFNSTTWWETELGSVFGVDVLGFDFDKEAGVSCTDVSDKLTFVLYNVERGMQRMPGILEELSGRRPVSIPFVNAASDSRHHKPYVNRDEIGRLYDSVRADFKLPAGVLEEVYGRRSCRFFYDEGQIAGFLDTWREPHPG